jgi:hypothetical protein
MMIQIGVANHYDTDGASLHAAIQSKTSYFKIVEIFRMKSHISDFENLGLSACLIKFNCFYVQDESEYERQRSSASGSSKKQKQKRKEKKKKQKRKKSQAKEESPEDKMKAVSSVTTQNCMFVM